MTLKKSKRKSEVLDFILILDSGNSDTISEEEQKSPSNQIFPLSSSVNPNSEKDSLSNYTNKKNSHSDFELIKQESLEEESKMQN